MTIIRISSCGAISEVPSYISSTTEPLRSNQVIRGHNTDFLIHHLVLSLMRDKRVQTESVVNVPACKHVTKQTQRVFRVSSRLIPSPYRCVVLILSGLIVCALRLTEKECESKIELPEKEWPARRGLGG